MRNYTFFIFSILLLLAGSCDTKKSDLVGRLDNEVITESELQHWMLLEKANVYNYFYQKFGVEDSEHFWTQKQGNEGNEVPLERLKKIAIENAKRCKVQQILALEKGIISTTNFDEIEKEMDKVNGERKLKVEKGEPIYGPMQFTSRTYFAHVFDKMVIELKNELAKRELKPSDEELRVMEKKAGSGAGENSGFLSMQYVDQHYEKYIDKLMSKTDMKLNIGVYDKIKLE